MVGLAPEEHLPRLRFLVVAVARQDTLVPILGGGNRRGDGIEVGDEPFGDALGTGLVKQPDSRIKGVRTSQVVIS